MRNPYDAPRRPIKKITSGPRLFAKDLTRHVLVTGGTGSGKSSCVNRELVQGSLLAGSPVFTSSVKDSDAGDYKRMHEEIDVPCILFGPKQPYVFPFLNYLFEDLGLLPMDVADVLMAAHEARSHEPTRGEDSIWVDSMRALLVHSLTVLRAAKQSITIENIDRFISNLKPNGNPNGNYATEVFNSLARVQLDNKSVVDTSGRYLTQQYLFLAPRTRSSVEMHWSALANDLLMPPLRTLFGEVQDPKLRVSPWTLLRDRTSVLLDFPIATQPRSGRVCLRIWLEAIKMGAQRKKPQWVVPIICDEFQSAGSARVIRNILAEGRSSNLAAILLTQTYSGLVAAFGQDEAHALLGLPGIKVICPNAGDAATLEYFSKSMGTQEIEEVSVSAAESRLLEDMFPRKTLTKKPVEKPRLKLRDLLALRPATPKRPTVETAVLINGKIYWQLWSRKRQLSSSKGTYLAFVVVALLAFSFAYASRDLAEAPNLLSTSRRPSFCPDEPLYSDCRSIRNLQRRTRCEICHRWWESAR